MFVIFGTVFTVLNYVFYCSSRFFRLKKKMLAFDLLAKLSTCLALYFLDALSGAYSMLLSFLILIAANLKERRQARWPAVYAVFQAALIAIMVWQFAGLPSVLVFCTASVSLLSIWWLPPQKMRVASMITSVTSLLYQLSIQNYAGLLECIVIGSNVLSFVKYQKQRRVKDA